MPKSNDVLILNKIVIEKLFQGNGYGLVISKKMIEIFGQNCSAILITPFPMQFSVDDKIKENWNKKYLSEKFDTEIETCRKKLLKYWKQLDKYAIVIKSSNPNIICIPQS